MPVIAALKLHNVFAFRISSRQADRRHGRFCPRTDEAHLLHVRKCRQHKLREIRFRRSGSPKTRSITSRSQDGIQHTRLRVAKNQRPPRSDVIDKLVLVRVPDVRALAPHNKWRIATHRTKRPHRRVHAAGNHALSALLQTARLLDFAGHRGRHQVLPRGKSLCSGGAAAYLFSSGVILSAAVLQAERRTLACTTASSQKRIPPAAAGVQINLIFIVPPRICNIAAVTLVHQVTLLTGRVAGQSRGLRTVLFICTAHAWRGIYLAPGLQSRLCPKPSPQPASTDTPW